MLVEPSVSSKVVRETYVDWFVPIHMCRFGGVRTDMVLTRTHVRMTELMFEKYEVPALFIAKDAVLNTYDGTRSQMARGRRDNRYASKKPRGHALIMRRLDLRSRTRRRHQELL